MDNSIAARWAEAFSGEHDRKPRGQEILHRFSRAIYFAPKDSGLSPLLPRLNYQSQKKGVNRNRLTPLNGCGSPGRTTEGTLSRPSILKENNIESTRCKDLEPVISLEQINS